MSDLSKYFCGFIITNMPYETDGQCNDTELGKKFQSGYNYIKTDGYTILYKFNGKFEKDKICKIVNQDFVLFDGIILNKNELTGGYESWGDYLYNVAANQNRYFEKFRGSYCGASYIKSKDELTVYTNQTGDKPVYYYTRGSQFVIGTRLDMVLRILKQNQIDCLSDEEAIYDILTYGFMTSDHTYVREVKRLLYGSMISINGGGFRIQRYYSLKYCENTKNCYLSDDEIVGKVDELFRKAVRLEFEKDDEYNYQHLACLSGGLDSRMTTWVAHDMGFSGITNVCFSQSDYLDETIAKKVSQSLDTALLVRSLNDGKFMVEFKTIIGLNEGISIYSGSSHVYGMFSLINPNVFGVIHTGELGDAILGAYSHKGENKSHFPGAYSTRLSSRKKGHTEENIEKFKMETRGFLGTLGSWNMTNYWAESQSPFLYKEFLDFCIGEIPIDKRRNHYIYRKWIISKYPSAAKIPVERYEGGFITDNKIVTKIRKASNMGMARTIEWFLWKLGFVDEIDRSSVGFTMNPFDKWYNTHYEIKNSLDQGFMETIEDIKRHISDQLYEDLIFLYREGNVTEKTQALTAAVGLSRLLIA